MSRQYWDDRYKTGKGSGKGSCNEWAKCKLDFIDLCSPLHSILDVGCGDLSFWKNRVFNDYIGFDWSKEAIEKAHVNRPDLTTFVHDATIPLEFKTWSVICLDILFHIKDEKKYKKIIENIFSYAIHQVIISTWSKEPTNYTKLHQQWHNNLHIPVGWEMHKKLFCEDGVNGIFTLHKKP